MQLLRRSISSLLFLLAICIFSTNHAFAQPNTGTIKGTVTTNDGKPAGDVSVVLKDTKKGAATNEKGAFEINKLKQGQYTLQISLTGYQTLERVVEVAAAKVAELNLELQLSNQQLQEVIVTSSRNKQPKTSVYVAKMPLKNIENPQVYNMVSADIFKQQVITNYEDALKNVPGIQKLWESTGRGGDGGSYYTLRGFEVQANIVNGLPGVTTGSLDPSNVERIEVIKGPSGTLFGSSLISYGGLINTVTKKPHANFDGEVTYIAGSFGLNRVTADVNIPLTKNGDVAARVNTAYQTENSFQDAGFRTSFFIAPSFSYKVNDKLSFLINTEFMQEEKTTPPMLFLGRNSLLQFHTLKDLNYNTKLSFYSNDLAIKNPRYSLQAQMIYKLSDKWTSQTALSSSSTKSNGYYSYIYDNENGNKDFSLYIQRDNSQTLTSDIQQNFVGDFNIGTMRNRLVVGLDYFHQDVNYGGSGWARMYSLNAQGDINYADPYNLSDTLPAVYLTQSSVDQLLATAEPSPYRAKNEVYSAYFSDVINLTPTLLAMASLRVDRFQSDDYGQTALSPKFGLLYQPVKDKLALFANYMNGFRNIGPTQVADEDGSNPRNKSFEPEHANQIEFGVKSNLYADKLNATISYYDIKVANLVTADPANFYNSLQGGEARSRGLEVDLNSNPVRGLSILVGYSYNDSKIIKGDDANLWLETGKRPIWAGGKHLANAWATYTFSAGALNGFGLGFGGNHSSAIATMDSKVTGAFMLPSYIIANASIFYNSNHVRLSFNVNNITDKQYFNGGWSTLNPQKTRNIAASLSYRF